MTQQFDETFQTHYLAHYLRDPVFWAKVHGQVNPTIFTSVPAQKVARLIASFAAEHKSPPGDLIFQELNELAKIGTLSEADHGILNLYLQKLMKVELRNRKYLLDKHNTFIRHQKLVAAFPVFTEAMRNNDLDAATALLTSLSKVTSEFNEQGSFFEADPTDRIHRRENDTEERFFLGIPELDSVLNGLKRRQVGVWLSQRSSAGKGHPHGTNVLTPTGYRKVEDLRVGEFVIGSNGKKTRITGVYHKSPQQIYEVRFVDGSKVRVDGDHLWSVRSWRKTQDPSAWKVISTSEIFNDNRGATKAGKAKWQIPLLSAPAEFDEQEELLLHPYLMGVFLGDGTFNNRSARITPGDELVPAEIAKLLPEGSYLVRESLPPNTPASQQSWRCSGKDSSGRNPVNTALTYYGLAEKRSWEKFIPEQFLMTSSENRLELLRGLMDTDGEVAANPASGRRRSYVFCSASEQLVSQVAFIVESLGGTARKKVKAQPKYRYKGETRVGRPSYRVTFCLPENLIASRVKAHLVPEGRAKYLVRSLIDVEPVSVEPSICISVEAEDSLYLTEHCIVTHNSAALIHLAKWGVLCGKSVMVLTLEDTKEDFEDKLDMCVAGVPTEGLNDHVAIKQAMLRWFRKGGRLHIAEFGPSKVSTLRSYVEFIAQTENFHPDVILLDYADLCEPEDKRLAADSYATGDEVYKELCRWAKDEDIVIWTAAQSGRGAMDAVVADQQHMAGSIAKIYHAHLVISINRTSAQADAKQTELYVVKNKNGHARFTKIIYSDFDRMHFRTTPQED